MINEERLINNFLDYVQIDSESGNEKEMCDYLSKQLKELGFEVFIGEVGTEIGSNGYNICAKLAGNPDKDPILLSSHVDTVSPGKGIKPIVDGDIIKTDGSTILGGDDKSGIAIIVECMSVIKDNNLDSRPIEACFSIYEEQGLKGAKTFDMSNITAKEGIIIDSGGPIGSIATCAPAQDIINVNVYGKAAHAGMEPEKGISAIQIAARAIDNMKLLRIDEETTANFGVINGGIAVNVVPEHIHLLGESRSTSLEKIDAQTAHMKEAFENAAKELGGRVEFDADRVYNPYYVDENSKIVQDLKAAYIETGFEPKCVSIGGGSDTNVYNERGLNCVNVSCGMSAVHSTDEFIKKSDIIGCATSLLAFLTK